MRGHIQQNISILSPRLSWLLKLRNLLAICLMVATIFIVVYSYISIKDVIGFTVDSANKTASNIATILHERSLKTAREQLIAEANAKAYQVGKELEKAITAATTLADVLSGMAEEGVIVDVGRDVVNGMLHTSLHTNKKFFGVYTIWEPDSFDMLDLAYAGSKGHDSTGRFIPYWYRGANDKITGKPCEDYDNLNKDKYGLIKGDFYLLPQKTGNNHIIDPRSIVINGTQKTIISVVAPILVEDKFLGITGIDLNPDFLQKIVDEASSSLIQKQGKLMIISHGGILVASSGSQEEAGTPIRTILENDRLSKNNEVENDVITYTPIVVERVITQWSIRIAISPKALRSDADLIYQKMMSNVDSTTEALNKKSMGALWKLAISGILLAISTLLITLLIRTLEIKERALKKNEKKYRDLIDNTPDLRYRTDMDGRIIFISPSILKLSGYTVQEAIGLKMAEDLYLIPEERKKLIAVLQRDGYIDDFESQIRRKDGSTWWASTNAHFFKNDKGTILGVEGVTRDITDRKQAEDALKEREEQYRAVVDNLGDSIMRYDCDYRHIYANPTALETTGLAADRYLGKTHHEMGFSEHLCQLWEKNIQLVFDTGKQQNSEFDVELAQGKMSMELQLNPEFATNGTVKSVIGISRDVTVRKQAEAEKTQLESLLRQAQKMEAIGTLAGGIAHDFNNILFPIVGFAEMLQEDLPQNSPEQESITEVLQAALRASDLVKQILTFSRQSDKELKPVKLQSILKEALKLLGSSIPKTIDIQTDIDPNCGVVVADPTQMHQIIMNLATNAYHAMQDSGGKLKISLIQAQIESIPLGFSELIPGKYALLKVIDTGIGIKKNVMDKIFDPYFSTKEKGKGTGLGLSVVQGIVKSCNGDIHIYSEPGKGTEIHVYLPIMKKASNSGKQDSLQPIQGGSERILLVDDEKAIIKMEQQVLERLGYQITSKTDSVEALEVFKANPNDFDLIITDMTMPKMTGLQLTNEIKAVKTDIPVIICTGFSDQINEEISAELGIQGYVTKPVIKREIAQTIRDVIEGSNKPIPG